MWPIPVKFSFLFYYLVEARTLWKKNLNTVQTTKPMESEDKVRSFSFKTNAVRLGTELNPIHIVPPAWFQPRP